MIRYVLCIVGCGPQEALLYPMVRKTRPEWQAGLLNFPGGKIHDHEPMATAASREFLEETGVLIAQTKWRQIAVLRRDHDFEMHVLFAWDHMALMAQTMTDETVFLLSRAEILIPELFGHKLVSNASWLLALSRDTDGFDLVATYPAHAATARAKAVSTEEGFQ
jgi:8-oxo-dGTP pyrophosphatase MutT (NUDIX family)